MNRIISRDLFFLPLAIATLALLWIVPAFPLAHLDDPGRWGVLGYVAILLLILRLRLRGIRGSRAELRLLALFLAGMPLVYLADWFRFGGQHPWLWIELLGAAPYWTLAVLGVRGSPWFLVAGIGGHALWDGWHYQRTAFVADWYVIGCLVIDLAFAFYAAGQVPYWRRPTVGRMGRFSEKGGC